MIRLVFELGLVVCVARNCNDGDFGLCLLVVAVVVLWLSMKLFLAMFLGFWMDFVVGLVWVLCGVMM